MIQRPDKNKEDDEKYNEFINNIQELGNKMTAQYSQPQQQYPGGPTGSMMGSPSGGMMGGPTVGMMASPMSGMMGSPSYYNSGGVPMMQQVIHLISIQD